MTPRQGAVFAVAIFALVPQLRAACPDAPTFTPGHYLATGRDPFLGFTADVNGDGKDDLVFFYNGFGGIEVFLGSASGILFPTPQQFVPSGGDIFESITGGDVNGDGKVDVVAGVSFDVRIYYGAGDGTFTAGPRLASPLAPAAERIADFNNDGRADIAAITAHDLLIFLQTAPGTFAAPIDIPVAFPTGVEVGDLDADGKPDIVTFSSDNVSIFFGNGDGTFAAPVVVHDPAWSTVIDPDSVAIHDFNFDGRPDLAVGVVNRGIQIVRNDGGRTFSLAQLIPEPQGGSVQIADFNHDGIIDLFASGYGGFFIVLANADGTFRPPQFTPVPPLTIGSPGIRSRYVLGDFRGLHRVDVATTKRFPDPQTIEVDLNDCESVGIPALSPLTLVLLAALFATCGAVALRSAGS